MTLDEVRVLIAQTQSPKQRAAAEKLVEEAIELPHLPPEQRAAAIARIRTLEPHAPDYQLQSCGANVLEIIGDSLTDPAQKKVAYAEALHLAEWYASCATSGGEGTARSMHVRGLEIKLQAIDPGFVIRVPSPPPLPPRHTPRPLFPTVLGWILIGAGVIVLPIILFRCS